MIFNEPLIDQFTYYRTYHYIICISISSNDIQKQYFNTVILFFLEDDNSFVLSFRLSIKIKIQKKH